MNTNKIKRYGFSNPKTYEEYLNKTKDGKWIENQCGGCSFFAPLNSHSGICCYEKGRFYLETVFEPFGCEKHVYDGYGWESHSFDDNINHPTNEELLDLLIECEKAFSCKKTALSKQNRNFHLKLRYFFNKNKELYKKHGYINHPILKF